MRLLASTDLPITDVSGAAGFSNANYFHKVFRDLVGVGPAALRKRWRALQDDVSAE
jgi:AraC-like DNA-binding protein